MLLFSLFGLYAAESAINLHNCVYLCVLWPYATSLARGVDEGVDTEPLLTRRKVLKAVSTINKYIDGLDDLVSRKIEGLLRSFNRQLCLNETKTMKIIIFRLR